MPRTNYRHGEETKRKIAESNRGQKRSAETRAKLSATHKGRQPWLGRKHSAAAKAKMSAAKVGKRPPNFIEDRTKLKRQDDRIGNAHKFWSRSVKSRDSWKCKLANENCEGKVVAHHILPWAQYPALRYEIKNGITLCRFHHPRTRDGEKKLIPTLQALVAG